MDSSFKSTIKDVSAVESQVRQDDREGSIKQGLYDESTLVLDPAAERRLCTKFDLRLMPILATMYLFYSLDKGSLSNAQTNGLGK
ncbi:hypothetical protein E4U30_001437, partial [Claviceps sp. LM220 group G6]